MSVLRTGYRCEGSAYIYASLFDKVGRIGRWPGMLFLFVLLCSATARAQSNRPPNPPQLPYPTDGATNVGSSVPLEVSVSDPDGDPLTVTFYGRRITTAMDFVLAIFGDTQNYYSVYQSTGIDYFKAQAQWIAANRAARNFAYVAHMGDVTNNNLDPEWVYGSNAMSFLEDSVTTGLQYGVPFGVEVGNHDERNGTTAPYNQYFGSSRYAGRDYYGGHYGSNNNNYYELFSAGGMDFIVIYLEFDVSGEPDVLNWADQLLKQYINRHGIIVSHEMLFPGNPAPWSGDGLTIYNTLKNNPNLFLMLCGHAGADYKRSDVYNGNTVYTMMTDYSGDTNGGNGYVRLLTISPNNNNIHATTYSPTAGTRSASPIWDLPINSFPVVGMTAASGPEATMTWNNLATCSQYEWYVTVSDGQAVTTGPRWTFATAGCSISGTVTNELGAGISGATVSYSGGSTTADASGNYTLSSVAPGTYTVTASASGYQNSTQTVTVTAGESTMANFTLTGGPSSVTLLPASLTFSDQLVGATSPSQGVTLQNAGSSAITISSVGITGDFSLTNHCSSSLAGNSSCTIDVSFAPTTTGTRSGTLTVTENSPSATQSVTLTGTGVAPSVSLSPTSVNFGSQAVSTTSPEQTVTLSNNGTSSLAITSISITGTNATDFTKTANTTCGSSLATSSSCQIKLTFTPTATGTRSAFLSISDNAPGSPQTVPLSGTGVAPSVSLSPTSLTFPGQEVNITSAPQSVTLTNSGTASLTITSIAASGDFVQTNTCGNSVLAGANCTISVTFEPTTIGTRTGAVTITDNAAGSPQTVNLTGTGTAAAASLSPTSLSFGNQALNTASSPQTVTLTNSGTAPLSITAVSITGANPGDFSQTNTCGTSVAAGANCTISVTFTPSAIGSRTASLSVSDNASDSPQTVGLTGTGTGTPAVTLTPASLTFPSQQVNTTSAPQTLTLKNTGTATLTISKVTTSGDYAATGCSGSVAVGATCTINVTFTPTATGTRTGSIAIADNASDSPQTVALNGNGTAPAVSFSPNSLSFGNQALNTASSPQTVTLSNTGTAALTVTGIALTGTNAGDFSQANTCGTSVAAGANCTISVAFTPLAIGSRTASLSVSDDAAGSPQTIPLSGNGTAATGAPTVTLTPTSLSFGDQGLNTTSPPQSVTLTNTGTATLTISSIAASGDFAQTNTCGNSVLAGASCQISVTFTPTAAGTQTGAVTITDNAVGSPQTVAMTGNGTGVATVRATLVRTIDTSLWSPPSPDPGGIRFIPSLGNYLVSDSEVNEVAIFTGVNLYEMSPDGNLVGTFSTTNLSQTGFSNEPTDVAVNELNGHWFISDDSKLRVFEIDLGPDQTFGTSDDKITFISTHAFNCDDPMGLAFDSERQVLFVADGAGNEVYKVSPGANGVFDGVPPAGDDVVTHFDTSVLGMTELQGIEYNPSTQTLYLVGGYSSSTVYEVNTDGVLVRIIDISAAEPALKAPAGLAYGPGSSGPNSRSLYVAARGQDNDNHPDENDGMIFELTLPGPVISSFSPTSGGESTPVTIVGTGFSGATSVRFNGVNATYAVSSDTQIDTSVPAGATTGPISVTAPGGTAASTTNFTITTGNPSVSLSPTSLTFPSQALNTTSSPQTVTLTNSGTAALTVTGIALTGANPGDFAQTNTCGGSVGVGATCTISVTFTPTATGSRSASLSISDDAAGSPQAVPLTGTGVAPSVSLSPTSLTFPSQEVNTTSGPQTVTLSNSGTATLTITSIAASGDFAQTNTCGGSVDAGQSCSISVTFTPTATGTRTGTLTITDNAVGSPQTVSLTGNGTAAPAPVVSSVIPSSLLMGTTATLAINGSNFAQGASLSFANGQGSAPAVNSLSVVNSTTIQARVTAPSNGPKRDRTWDVVVTNPDGSSGVLPAGLTVLAAGPVVSLSPTSLNFGTRQVDTISTPQTVTLSNTGNAPLTISDVALSGTNPGDFAQTNGCGSSLAAGANCAISVTFTPTATGSRVATISIADNAGDSPQTVSLSGSGESTATPAVKLTPSSLTFGSQEVDTTSAAQTVTLTNTGTATLNISNITASGDFAQTNNCETSLVAGASCSISVTFRPTATGTRTGAVTITDNAGSSPQVVSLSGTGVSAATVVVESIAPNSLPAGTTTTLTITGLNFASGALLSFANGQGSAPSVNSVTFVNSGMITASVTAPSNGPKRNRVWDVVVTNPDGSSGRLPGGFTVTY